MPPSTIAPGYTFQVGQKAAPGPAARLQEKVTQYQAAGHGLFLPLFDRQRFSWLPAHVRAAVLLALKDHPAVKPALLGKLFAVSSLDLQSTAASEDPRDEEIAEFVRYQFDGVLTVPEVCLEILYPAMVLPGPVVCEQVWDADLWGRGRWAGKRFRKAVKAKAGARVERDAFGNDVAVVGPGPGGGEERWEKGSGLEDFLVYRHLPFMGDGGTPDLLPVYELVRRYETLQTLRDIHLDKFTSPTVHATYTDPQSVDDSGNPVTTVSILEPKLRDLKARGYILTPADVDIKSLELATRGEAEFQAALADIRQQIIAAIAGAFLQMATAASGGGDMRGDGQTHKSTAELFVWALASFLCAVLNRRAVPPLVTENFGAGADYPTLTLGGINLAEAKQQADLYKTARDIGARPSRKAFAKATGVQLAAEDADALGAPQVLPGFDPGGGGPFSIPPREGTAGNPTERASLIADVLSGVFGDQALSLFDEPATRLFWDEAQHPRGPDGKFIEAFSQQAYQATSAAIRQTLAGPKNADTHKKLTEHLMLLSTAQLKQIKAEHQISASGKNKAELTAKIADRLSKSRMGGAVQTPGVAAKPPEAPKNEPRTAPQPGPAAKPAAKGTDHVKAVVEHFQALQEHATHHDYDPARVDASIKAISGLPREELQQVAKGLGIERNLGSRAEYLDAIRNKIAGMRENTVRTTYGGGKPGKPAPAGFKVPPLPASLPAPKDSPARAARPAAPPAEPKPPPKPAAPPKPLPPKLAPHLDRINELREAAGRPGFDMKRADRLAGDLKRLPKEDVIKVARAAGIERRFASKGAAVRAIVNNIKSIAESTIRTSFSREPPRA